MKKREPIGRQIRRKRTARRMTQAQLAVAAGVGHNTVCQVERGRPTKTDTLESLAGALGCDLRIVLDPREAAA